MPLGTSYVNDTVPYVSNGVVQQLTLSQANTTFGAGNVKTASKSFSLVINGHTIHFAPNVPHYCDAQVIAALTLHGAPVA